jgi:hypothetical protein
MRSDPQYPLTFSWLLLSLMAGSFVGVATDNLSAAYAIVTLITSCGIVWRAGDPPILPFILAFQWVSVTAGYWYELWYGSFPGYYRPGDVEHTMFLSLTGLLLLAIGIRVASQLILSRTRAATEDRAIAAPNLIRPLFLVVMASYSVEYVYTLSAREFGSMASFVQRLLEFRQVLLVTLWLEILRSRTHLAWLVVSFVWATLPRLGGYYSDFKSPVVLLLIALAASWRPWEEGWWKRTMVAGAKAAPVLAALLILLLVWQGGLKKNTRLAHDDGSIGVSASDRISFFAENFRTELPLLFEAPEPYVEALVERMSYITFFSRVLEHVPAREPHAEGELLSMAMENAFVPRFLVPEKPELPSDSYYTRRFAGVLVAETGTSVSIGYMAEFYADWGLGGMFLSILAFGLWIGVIAAVVRVLTPAPLLRFAAMTVVLLAVADFEQQFIKGFAALNLNAMVTLVLVRVVSPWVTRIAQHNSPAVSPDAGEALPVSTP